MTPPVQLWIEYPGVGGAATAPDRQQQPARVRTTRYRVVEQATTATQPGAEPALQTSSSSSWTALARLMLAHAVALYALCTVSVTNGRMIGAS